MSEASLLKNHINADTILILANSISRVYGAFDTKGFIKQAQKNLDEKELKQRVQHLIDLLCQYMPQDFEKSADILFALADFWRKEEGLEISGFTAWPVIDYVPVVGLDKPILALELLEKLTPHFSAEFAIRPFYEQHQKLTLETARTWTQDSNEHVRRLASEGLRPRLPWGKQLRDFKQSPQLILPILEQLMADESLYVRKSVANCLNDISKDHPDFLINVCREWLQLRNTLNENQQAWLQWVITRGTRSLVKQGHPESFTLLGYTENPQIKLGKFALESDAVALGQELHFSFDLCSLADEQSFVVDFCVYYQKANGTLSPKVFKLKNCLLNAGESMRFSKHLSFKALTTRSYHLGEHQIAIHINGKEMQKQSFYLLEK